MNNLIKYFIDNIVGIIIGVLGTICYNKLHIIYRNRKKSG